MLILAMDANFRLKNRMRANDQTDPELGPGWAYFVNNSPYATFIKDYVDDEEVRQFLNMLSMSHSLVCRLCHASVFRPC